jgi:hypothetical protein
MDNHAYRSFEPGAGLPAGPARVEPAGGPGSIVARRDRDSGPAPLRTGEDEADYCRARAEAEARRGDEASHPAARAAHLELATLYRARALGAVQAGIPEIQDWTSEGGRWLAEE